MSSISVKWQGANSAKSKYAQHRRELSEAAASVRSIKSYRCMDGGGFSSVYSALDRVITRLEDEKKDMESLETSTTEVLKAYQDCERQLVDGIKAESADEKENIFTSGAKWVWNNVIPKIGPAGTIVKLIGDGATAVKNLVSGQWEQWIIDGEWTKVAKDIVSPLKDINLTIGGISGIVANVMKEAAKNNVAVTWKDFLKKDWWGGNNALAGLAQAVDSGQVEATFRGLFAKSWESQFDFSLPAGATTADKVKLGTKWAGYALTAISNGIENYEEYKSGDISGGRAVAETAIETGVDIALTAGATAAISAGAVALGITAAPAVAVGVAAAGVVWAANGVCKWVTGGRDIGEVVADGVIDGAKWVGEQVGNLGEAIGDGAKAVKDTVTGWGQSLWNSIVG